VGQNRRYVLIKAIWSLSLLLITILFSKSIIYAQEMSVPEIVEKASKSIVRIDVYDMAGTRIAQGSGFFIAPGKILTNAHVIEDAYSAEIFPDHSSSRSYKRMKILKINNKIDLALLEVEDRDHSYLLLGEEREEIRPGQHIITIGNPMGLDKTVADGLISAVRYIPSAFHKNKISAPSKVQEIQISAPTSPGSSGGPLLNSKGRVIGVTYAGMEKGENLNFAIGIETIWKFLKEPYNVKTLAEAKSRVFSAAVFSSIKKILYGFIKITFDRGWWIYLAGIFFIVWIVRNLINFFKVIFRNKRKSFSKILRLKIKSISKGQLNNYKLSEKKDFSKGVYDKNNQSKGDFKFYCWKCGKELNVNLFCRPGIYRCLECKTILKVPKE